MTELDLDNFGPWRDGICDECQTLQLVVGTPEGPKRCKPCWLEEEDAPASRRRAAARPLPDDVPMFNTNPYEKRERGA